MCASVRVWPRRCRMRGACRPAVMPCFLPPTDVVVVAAPTSHHKMFFGPLILSLSCSGTAVLAGSPRVRAAPVVCSAGWSSTTPLASSLDVALSAAVEREDYKLAAAVKAERDRLYSELRGSPDLIPALLLPDALADAIGREDYFHAAAIKTAMVEVEEMGRARRAKQEALNNQFRRWGGR